MPDLNVPLNELLITEGLDFSHRGTPLASELPEHYTNKRYAEWMGNGSTPQCNGTSRRARCSKRYYASFLVRLKMIYGLSFPATINSAAWRIIG
jgi:hypothetical protein